MKRTIVKIICKGCELPLYKFSDNNKCHHNKECLKIDRLKERQKISEEMIKRKGVK